MVFNQNYIDDLNNVDYFQGDGLIQENNKNEIILENEEEIYLNKKEEIVNAIRDGENEIREDKNEIKDGNIKLEDKNENNRTNYYFNNNMIKKLIETYLENDNFLFYDVNKNIEGNNIQLLLGLRLPGIYLTLKEIIYYIRNEIIIKNFNIERDIINLRDEDRIDFGKELENYRNRLKNNLKNAEKEILKNKTFNKINNIEKKRPKEIYQFYSLLMNDYFLIFLSENLYDIKELYKNFDCYKNLLNLMLSQRFKNGNSFFEIEPIKSFTKKIVWIETYRQYISIILKIYEKISKYESDLINKINILIKDNEISLDEDEIRNPYHTLDLKSPFYYVTEALFRIIFDIKFLEKLKGQDFYDYINLLKTIIEESLIIYENLSIDPKEILIIQEFINIEEALNNVNKSNEENLLKIQKF